MAEDRDLGRLARAHRFQHGRQQGFRVVGQHRLVEQEVQREGRGFGRLRLQQVAVGRVHAVAPQVDARPTAPRSAASTVVALKARSSHLRAGRRVDGHRADLAVLVGQQDDGGARGGLRRRRGGVAQPTVTAQRQQRQRAQGPGRPSAASPQLHSALMMKRVPRTPTVASGEFDLHRFRRQLADLARRVDRGALGQIDRERVLGLLRLEHVVAHQQFGAPGPASAACRP